MTTTYHNVYEDGCEYEADYLYLGSVPCPKHPAKTNGAQEKDSAGGTKYDNGKPPISLVVSEAIWEEARVMGFGEKKYGTWNWTKGLSILRLLSAAMRHILQFLMGEDNDKETGIIHLAHARCCLGMAIWTYNHRKDLDDRYKGRA